MFNVKSSTCGMPCGLSHKSLGRCHILRNYLEWQNSYENWKKSMLTLRKHSQEEPRNPHISENVFSLAYVRFTSSFWQWLYNHQKGEESWVHFLNLKPRTNKIWPWVHSQPCSCYSPPELWAPATVNFLWFLKCVLSPWLLYLAHLSSFSRTFFTISHPSPPLPGWCLDIL